MAFKLDDTVIARVIQIIQEAFLTQTDCTDLMRMIEIEQKQENDDGRLVLTEQYKKQVENYHEELLSKIDSLRSAKDD